MLEVALQDATLGEQLICSSNQNYRGLNFFSKQQVNYCALQVFDLLSLSHIECDHLLNT